MDTQVSNDAVNAALGVYEWGGVKIDLDAIPPKVKANLIQIQLRHKLGNEVAASWLKVKEKDPDADEEAETLRLREEMVSKILDGTIGLRVGGPRGNTIENIAWELAQKQAEETLGPKGYWPKADRKAGIKAEDAVIDFNGTKMNREELTDLVFEKYKDRFMNEAKEEHARRQEKAKLAKQNAVKTVDKVEKSAEDVLNELI